VEVQLRPTALTWHVVGTEVVVLDLEGSVYLKLNGSGRVLWELLVDAAGTDALAAALVDAYGIAEDRARADVDEFLGELRRRGLLAA
jgi:hypothetical protein